MKKSIFLFFATLLCAMSVNAKDIYADMSSAPSWYADAYIHYWDGSSDKYVKLEETGISKLLKATINDNYQGWRVCRYVNGGRHNDCTWISDKNVNKFIVNSSGNGGSSTTIIGLVTGGHIYFDNLETQWTGNIQFVVGHDSYSRTYEMNQISNTHLWYVNLTDKDYHTWGDAKYYGFIASGSKFGDGGWGSSNLKNATSYTKAYTSTYSLNEGAIYYCKMSATANGSTFSIDYKGSKNDIPKYDATQAAKVRNSKTDAYTDINGAWPATLKLEGTYLDNNSTAKRSDITSTTSTDDANKRVYEAVRSGKVTHTYANLSEDYHFEGWGTADAPTSADASYEYNITENTTVYAFFTKKYPVNFSADANGSVIATADEEELTSGNKVVGGTTITLTANPAGGYHFEKWSNGSTDNPLNIEVTEAVELQAIFAINTYTISATANPTEGGTIEGAGTYDHGSNVTLTATANEGYKFVNWTKEDVEVSTDATYTFTATKDAELVANFKATTITLTTGDNSAVIEANIGNTVNVVIERSFTANDGYYTLCVPFNMPASVIGKAYSLGDITKHVAGGGININLKEENELSAGMPYLVLPKANMSELVVENVTILPDGAAGQSTQNDELNVKIFFQGYYSASGQTNGSSEYYVGNNGDLYNGGVDIRGLCGLFTITDTETNPINIRARVVAREDAATGFENITNGENTTIKLIENGQLIIIRNGEKFNAQGVRF